MCVVSGLLENMIQFGLATVNEVKASCPMVGHHRRYFHRQLCQRREIITHATVRQNRNTELQNHDHLNTVIRIEKSIVIHQFQFPLRRDEVKVRALEFQLSSQFEHPFSFTTNYSNRIDARCTVVHFIDLLIN